MSPVFIRQATIEDVSIICEFVIRLADYEERSNEVTFTQDMYVNNLFTNPSSPKPEVLLVSGRADERPTGFALFIQTSLTSIHLEDLYVDPSSRGKGYGIALLVELAKIARKRQVNELEWNCLDWNKPSIDFYHSIGAVAVSDQTIYRIAGESLTKRLCPEVPVLLGENTISDSVESLEFTLSFTTFKGTPVFLVTGIHPLGAKPTQLFDHLIHMAQQRGYSRIDVQVDNDPETAEWLVSEFHAFPMTGWIPFTLSGDSLTKLANTNGPSI
jgi:GNAT superfamily N-acetyltransferase